MRLSHRCAPRSDRRRWVIEDGVAIHCRHRNTEYLNNAGVTIRISKTCFQHVAVTKKGKARNGKCIRAKKRVWATEYEIAT